MPTQYSPGYTSRIRITPEEGGGPIEPAVRSLVAVPDGLVLELYYEDAVARALARGTLCRVTAVVTDDDPGRPWDYGRLAVARAAPSLITMDDAVQFRVELVRVPEREG